MAHSSLILHSFFTHSTDFESHESIQYSLKPVLPSLLHCSFLRSNGLHVFSAQCSGAFRHWLWLRRCCYFFLLLFFLLLWLLLHYNLLGLYFWLWYLFFWCSYGNSLNAWLYVSTSFGSAATFGLCSRFLFGLSLCILFLFSSILVFSCICSDSSGNCC